MTKRKKWTIALSLVTLTLVGVGAAAGLTNGFRNEPALTTETLSATAVENIRFLKVEERELADGVIEKKIGYELVPADAKNADFNCYLSWSEEQDAHKENATWKEGKDIGDYMTYALDTTRKELTFRCLQPFGHEIQFVMAAPSNPDIQAKLSMDYRRKLLSPASITANNILKDGTSLSYKVTNETYSIGTIGEGTRELKATASIYYENQGRSIGDMLGSPIITGAYAESFRYQGKQYGNASDLVSAVETGLTQYLQSLTGSSKTFLEEDLKEILTYEYYAYRTYQEVYLPSEKLYTQFLTAYSDGKDKSGYYLSIDAEGKASYKERVDIDVELVKLSGIEFESDNIEF